MMRRVVIVICLLAAAAAFAQKPDTRTPAEAPSDYSGMYTFLADGEFVQFSQEPDGRITGFVSRYGTLPTDRGRFLDHWFKKASLNDGHVEFTTDSVHGTWYAFTGTIGRGEGKRPGAEGYYVMRGTLTEHMQDKDGKEQARTREVTFRSFPQEP